MTYRFQVLGDFKARRRGSPDLTDVTRHELLLAILLAAEGQAVQTKTLYGWCWQPDEHPDEWWDDREERERALNKLDVALTMVRKTYTDPDEGVVLSRRTPSRLYEASTCTLTVPKPSPEVQGLDPNPDIFLLDAHFLSACIARARDTRAEPFPFLEQAVAVWAPPFSNIALEEAKIPALTQYRSDMLLQLESAISDLLEPALRRGRAADIVRILRTYQAGVESEGTSMIYAQALYDLGRHLDAESALSEAYTSIRARTGLSPSPPFQELLKKVRNKPVLSKAATPGTDPPVGGPALGPAPRDSPWLPDYLGYVTESFRTIPLHDFLADLLRYPNSDTSYAPLLAEPRLGELRVQAQPIPLTKAVETTRTTVLVGDSGVGKSTFLRWHAHQVASGSQSGEPDGRVPVVVDLSRLNEVAIPRSPSPDYLTDQIRLSLEEIGFSVESAELASMATEGRLELLLDALNEIVDGDARQTVSDLISRYGRRYPECRVVLTTTPSVARTTLPMGFVPVTVYGFGEPQMKLFLEELAPRLGRSVEDAANLLDEVSRSPELELFARTPLYLTAIATRFFEGGRLPRTRAAALASAVDWQLRRRTRALQPSMAEGKAVGSAFEFIALEMLRSGGAGRKRIGRAHLVSVLTRLGLCADPAAADRFVEGASAGGGPLIPTGGRGDFTFHDAIRDYLAARCLARMETDDESPAWWDEVELHLDDPMWEQPIRFLASCLLDVGWEAVTALLDRIAAASRALAMPERVHRVARTLPTLQDLLVDATYDLAEAHQFNDLIRTVSELHFCPHPEIPLGDRVDACTAIGVMGDNRLTDQQATVAWLKKTEVAIGCPENARVAKWELGPELVSFPLFGLRRFLVTVFEFERFVHAGCYGDDDLWPADHRAWRAGLGISAPLDWEIQRLSPNHPVTGVSWYEAAAYCKWMSRARPDGWLVRLPTEREWEYAARYCAGPHEPFPWGPLEAGDRAQANWAGTHLRHKTPVGMFPPSSTPDGVADLFGNVEEWCEDEWDRTEDEVLSQRFLALASVVNPNPAPARVVRGGSCIRYARLCRPGYRSRILEGGRYHTVGFRWVLVAPDQRGSA